MSFAYAFDVKAKAKAKMKSESERILVQKWWVFILAIGFETIRPRLVRGLGPLIGLANTSVS